MELTVAERAAEVDDVRKARRRNDVVVVPALAGAVADVLRRGQVGEDRRARGVVGAVETSAVGAGVTPVTHSDVHPRLAVRQRGQRERGAIVAPRRIQRRLDLRPGGAVVQRAPHAFRERGLVEDVGIVGIDADLGGSPNEGSAQERPGGAGLPVDAAGHQRVAGGAAGARAAGHRGDAAHRAGDTGQQVAALVEGETRHRALEEDVAARDQQPGLAAVGGLEDADARLGVARGVGFAGADVDGVPARVTRVDEDRADRVRPRRRRRCANADERPGRFGAIERLVGDPDAAAGRAEVEPAVAPVAGGRDAQRGHAAGGDVWGAVEEEDVEQRGVARLVERSDRRPLAYRLPVLLERLEPGLRVQRRFGRNLVGGIGAERRLLLRIAQGHPIVFGERLVLARLDVALGSNPSMLVGIPVRGQQPQVLWNGEERDRSNEDPKAHTFSLRNGCSRRRKN